ncbi:MAG: hypothetical protein K2M16_05290, partial [Muribaculaceae bacterium]|nr:hypothetical protein [Muribaculaceae bacterium]
INLGYVHFADMSRWRDPDSKKSVRAYAAAVSAVLLDFFTLVVLEGNVPKKEVFSIRKFLINNPCTSDNSRKRLLAKSFRNPFFINEVIYASTHQDSLYLHIDLDHALLF